jgi:hypothetical protein
MMIDLFTSTTLKDIIDIISSVITTTLIIVGGILAWQRWGREKPQATRGDFSHDVSNYCITKGQRLIHITLFIKNTGTVRLAPCSAYTMIQKVTPQNGNFENKLLSEHPPMAVTKT